MCHGLIFLENASETGFYVAVYDLEMRLQLDLLSVTERTACEDFRPCHTVGFFLFREASFNNLIDNKFLGQW